MAIGYLIILGIIFFSIGAIRGSLLNEKSAGTVCETSRNFRKSAKVMGEFLRKRSWVCRLDVCKTRPFRDVNGTVRRMRLPAIKATEWIYSGRGIGDFVRICHFLGCEVILRQVGSVKEEDELEFTQIKTKMRPEFVNKGIDFTYDNN